MTIHCFEAYFQTKSSVSEEQVESAFQNWMNQNPDWSNDLESHFVAKAPQSEFDTSFWQAKARFITSVTKERILESFNEVFKEHLKWYRIGYHQCSHDASPGNCGWDDVKDYNESNLPDEVPTFENL